MGLVGPSIHVVDACDSHRVIRLSLSHDREASCKRVVNLASHCSFQTELAISIPNPATPWYRKPSSNSANHLTEAYLFVCYRSAHKLPYLVQLEATKAISNIEHSLSGFPTVSITMKFPVFLPIAIMALLTTASAMSLAFFKNAGDNCSPSADVSKDPINGKHAISSLTRLSQPSARPLRQMGRHTMLLHGRSVLRHGHASGRRRAHPHHLLRQRD